MSKRYAPVRTNRTPWTDEVKLISTTETADNDGYVTVAETETTITCTFSIGLNRAEFYEGMKAGIRLSATLECWEWDYSNQTLCEYNGKRYQIIRAYESGRGTIELSLAEVIR